MCFGMKDILKNNCYHTTKHHRNDMHLFYFLNQKTTLFLGLT
jgi:hypothetical protein